MTKLLADIAQINSPTVITEVMFETGAASYLDFPINWDRIIKDAEDRGEPIRGVVLRTKEKR